jgi:hypothetical protein
MCGATISIDANKCPNCGESFTPTVSRPSLFRARVTKAGLLPGAVVGAVGYLTWLIHTRINFPAWEFSPEEPIFGILFGAIVGALVGASVAAVVRAFRSVDPEAR